MGFLTRVFVAVFVVCAVRGAWAQCCWCESEDECPEGYEIVSQNAGCESCGAIDCVSYCGGNPPGQYCDSFQDQCPAGLESVYKCKVINQDCGSGCKMYQTCNSMNGYLGSNVVSEDCHMENDTCYSNTRACNMFANRTENYDISCAQSSQQGQAEWNGNAWNVGNCGCDITNVEIGTGPFGIPWWCDSFNADFHVSSANQNVSSASGKIVYTLSRMYCAKCHPGYLPKIETSAQINGIYVRPENSGNGNWGVGMCSEQVTQPDYADGCVIKFNLPTGADAYDDCRKECPTGFKTQEQGAESINDCVAQYTPDFEDQTGTFVLTSLDSCP